MLTAIQAPFYDVGVLSSRGMLPGLDAILGSAVLERLSLLKYRNARGSHIYLRPSGEHRYTVLDDLNEAALAKLSADGFEPCAVVETSSANFQAWLKQAADMPKLLGTFAAQTLAARYGADPSAADWRRFGRLPGFTNCKPKYRRDDGLFPFVRLRSHFGQQFSQAQAFLEEITGSYEVREREQRRAERALSPRGDRGLSRRSNVFGLYPSTATDRLQRTSRSVLLRSRTVWTKVGSRTLSKVTIFLGIRARQSERPTFGEPWARLVTGWLNRF